MPYRSRRYVKPYGSRKRVWKRNQPGNKKVAWYNKKYSVGSLATMAFRKAVALKGLVNSEMLQHDFTLNDTPSSTGSINHMSNIAQSDASTGRTGNSIFAKWLSVRYLVNVNASATVTGLRIMIVMDRQQVGDTTPTIANVLDTAATNAYLAFLNPDTKGRFSVLYDKIETLNITNQRAITRRVNIKLDKHIRFNGANATDIQKNGIYIIGLSNEATNTPGMAVEARLAYHDN